MVSQRQDPVFTGRIRKNRIFAGSGSNNLRKTELIEKNRGKPLKFNVFFLFIMLKYENKYFDGHV